MWIIYNVFILIINTKFDNYDSLFYFIYKINYHTWDGLYWTNIVMCIQKEINITLFVSHPYVMKMKRFLSTIWLRIWKSLDNASYNTHGTGFEQLNIAGCWLPITGMRNREMYIIKKKLTKKEVRSQSISKGNILKWEIIMHYWHSNINIYIYN